MTDKHPSRRRLLAAGASAAISGAIAAPLIEPSAVETAIVRHITAYANYLAAIADDAGDAECNRLGALGFEALLEVARAPARDDAELLRKVIYCFRHERDVFGIEPDSYLEFGSVTIALDQHLGSAE